MSYMCDKFGVVMPTDIGGARPVQNVFHTFAHVSSDQVEIAIQPHILFEIIEVFD